MPPSAVVTVLGPAASGHTLVSGRLSVGRNAIAGGTCAMPIIRTHVRPAGEVEPGIEHQFELLSTVRAPSDKTLGPARIRAGRPGRDKSRASAAPCAGQTVADAARRPPSLLAEAEGALRRSDPPLLARGAERAEEHHAGQIRAHSIANRLRGVVGKRWPRVPSRWRIPCGAGEHGGDGPGRHGGQPFRPSIARNRCWSVASGGTGCSSPRAPAARNAATCGSMTSRHARMRPGSRSAS